MLELFTDVVLSMNGLLITTFPTPVYVVFEWFIDNHISNTCIRGL